MKLTAHQWSKLKKIEREIKKNDTKRKKRL